MTKTPSSAPRSGWSQVQGALFVGGVIALLLFGGLSLGCYLAGKLNTTTRPEPPPDSGLAAVDGFSPSDTWEEWKKYQKSGQLPEGHMPFWVLKNRLAESYFRWSILTLIPACLGAMVIVVALRLPSKPAPAR